MLKRIFISLLLLISLSVTKSVFALPPDNLICIDGNCIEENEDGNSTFPTTYNFTADSFDSFSFIVDSVVYYEDIPVYIPETFLNNNIFYDLYRSNVLVDQCSDLNGNYLKVSYESKGEAIGITVDYIDNHQYSFYLGDTYYEYGVYKHIMYKVYDVCDQYMVTEILPRPSTYTEPTEGNTEDVTVEYDPRLIAIGEYIVNNLEKLDMSGDDIVLNLIDSGFTGGSMGGPLYIVD